MQDLIYIAVAAACGITAFIVILRRYGSECIP